MTIFSEGAQVEWAAGGFKAVGQIISLGTNSAHIKWANGPDEHNITLVNLFDIEPVTAARVEDPMHLVAVRRAYDNGKEDAVLNFLATNNYLDSWTKIAQDVLIYAEDRLRKDASFELVDEQLTAAEKSNVVTVAALALLRDAFGEPEIEG